MSYDFDYMALPLFNIYTVNYTSQPYNGKLITYQV